MTKDEMIAALKARGVKVDISACGCCSSPWVTIELDDAKVETDNESWCSE